jgi:hypothetical protein
MSKRSRPPQEIEATATATADTTSSDADARDAKKVDASLKPPLTSSIAQSPPRVGNLVSAPPADAPMSPSNNRDRFHASCMPSSISCDLSSVSTQAGLKFSFAAIVLIVYPASTNPTRRHVLLSDGRGTVGITVWNSHVSLFSSQSVGKLAQFTKVALTIHNSTRGLVLNKDSTLVLSEGLSHFASTWWNSLCHTPPLQAILFHDAPENSVVNVAGILGSVCKEEKTVRNAPMNLVTLRIVDRTGVVCIRSWCHSEDQFLRLVDKPLLIKRIRVTAYANTKTGELLDGDGSIFDEVFDSSDLVTFWSE